MAWEPKRVILCKSFLNISVVLHTHLIQRPNISHTQHQSFLATLIAPVSPKPQLGQISAQMKQKNMRYVRILVKGLHIKSSEAQQLGDFQMIKQRGVLDGWRIFPYPLWEDHNVCLPEHCTSHDNSKIRTSIHGNTPGRRKRSGWRRRWPNSSQCALPGFQAVLGHAEGSTHLCAPPPPPTPTSPFSHSDPAYPSDERGQHICAQLIHRDSLHICQWHTAVFPKALPLFDWAYQSLFGFDQQQY